MGHDGFCNSKATIKLNVTYRVLPLCAYHRPRLRTGSTGVRTKNVQYRDTRSWSPWRGRSTPASTLLPTATSSGVSGDPPRAATPQLCSDLRRVRENYKRNEICRRGVLATGGAPARADAGGPGVPAGRVGSRGLKEVGHYWSASSECSVRHHWALES